MKIDRRASALTSRQAGLITRQQAARLGFTDRMISHRMSEGEWIRVHPGVFRMAGTDVSFDQALRAAVLWAGEGAALSHRTAAALLDLPGSDPEVIEVTSLRRLRSKAASMHCHITNSLPARDIETTRGLPRTSAPRTLADLGSCLPRHILERALDDALRRKLTTLRQLRRFLERPDMVDRPGVGYLRTLVFSEDVTESVLERMTLRLLRSSKILPPPKRQFEVHDPQGRTLRLDFAFPEARLAVEADGHRFHSDVAGWDKDLARRNSITAEGWNVIHVTWKALKSRPQQILHEIESVFLGGITVGSVHPRTDMYKFAE